MKKFCITVLVLFVALFGGATIVNAFGDHSQVDSLASSPTITEIVKAINTDAAVETKATNQQEQALRAAEQYLEFGGFSKAGLLQQLTSEFDQHKKADVLWALERVEVDWNAEAVESAELYLSTTAFSRSGLIDQMTSKVGSGFTKKQAEYAADKVGL